MVPEKRTIKSIATEAKLEVWLANNHDAEREL